MSEVGGAPGMAAVRTEGVPYGLQLHRRAVTEPHGVGLVVVARDGSERTLSWDQLNRRANQWGRVLAERGAGVGSTVALAIPNSDELVLATFGAWKIGAVPVPVRWDLPDWERTRLLDVIGAPVVIDEQSRGVLASAAASRSDDELPVAVSPMTNGICSSGSTGLPKVILSLQSAVWTPQHSEPFILPWTSAVSRPQTILVPGPLYHLNGFNTLDYLLGGDRLVMLEKFDAALILDLIERHRITTFTAAPLMLARIADVPGVESRDLSSIEWILQGAAVMPTSLLERWFKLLSPEQILMVYGMTERLGMTAVRGDEWLAHPGSVGRGFRATEIRILDDEGKTLGPGHVGEIYLRSPMSAGYRYLGGAPALPVTEDGFGSGGDLGHLDADGYLYIADRRSDLIVTGGANVFPAEVESALADHADIADVVVVGLLDPEWGRRVHAVVQPVDPARPPSQQDVIGYAKSRLAPYKVPKTVEFVDEMPRSAATKVSRSEMIRVRGG